MFYSLLFLYELFCKQKSTCNKTFRQSLYIFTMLPTMFCIPYKKLSMCVVSKNKIIKKIYSLHTRFSSCLMPYTFYHNKTLMSYVSHVLLLLSSFYGIKRIYPSSLGLQTGWKSSCKLVCRSGLLLVNVNSRGESSSVINCSGVWAILEKGNTHTGMYLAY